MAEKGAVAIQIAKEPTTVKPFQPESLAAHVNAMFDAISRRAYEIFEGSGRTAGHELEDWFQAEKELLHPVHIQVNETESAVEVKAEVPGFNEKELEITVEPQMLTITGKRQTQKGEKKGKTIYSEACSDEIMRVVELPVEVETDNIEATLKNGILQLELPKAAAVKSAKIETKAA